MNLALNPEIERFIQEQIQAGNFPNAEAVIEAAIAEYRQLATPELDEATLDAVDEAEAEFERGESKDWKTVSAELRREYLGG